MSLALCQGGVRACTAQEQHRVMYRLILSSSPWTSAYSRLEHADILACMSWHSEENIFGTALLRKLTKSKTVTGTIFEVHRHVDKVERRHELQGALTSAPAPVV